MNNGFGINFLRFVHEEDQESWSQVFARVPFDDVELKQKGALFGVVRSKEIENWADTEVEMTSWVEEYFNGVEVGGDLGSFFGKFTEIYPRVGCVWVWVVLDTGERKIKMVGNEDGHLVIQRGSANINLSNNITNGKVIIGEFKTNDKLWMWVGGLSEDFTAWDKEMSVDLSGSFAAFKIEAAKIKVEEIEVGEEEVESLPMEKEVVEEEKIPAKVTVFEKETLASDKYVGPVGFAYKIKNLFKKKEVVRVASQSNLPSAKRWSFVFGLLFLGLLITSLFFGNVRKKGIENQNKWLSFSEPIEKKIGEAVALVKINQNGSKKLVEDARDIYNLKKFDFEKGDKKLEVEALGKKIEETWMMVSGERKGNVDEVVNLALIRAGVNASRISYVSGSKFVVISEVSGVVMSVDAKSKDIKVVAGKGSGLGWFDAVSDGNKYFVMSKGGLFVVGNESNSLVFDTAVTEPLSLARFGTSVYVLEKGNKEIFKYSVNGSDIGDRSRWLKEGQIISTVPVDLDIDVDVWVLGEKGVVERFRRGVVETFHISGLPENVDFEKISVEKSGDRIALLSIKSGAVSFCSKTTGVCNQQVKVEALKEARDIEFDDENKLMVLFPGTIGVLN